MKERTKNLLDGKLNGFLGLAAVMLSFSLTLAGCDDGSGNTDPGNKTPNTNRITTVTITGPAKVSQVLTATAKDSSGAAVTDAVFQWKQADSATGTYSNIDGATNSTYTPVTNDVGKYIKVEADNAATDTPALSNPAGPVTAADDGKNDDDTATTKEKAVEAATAAGNASSADELADALNSVPGVTVPEGFAEAVGTEKFTEVRDKVKELLEAIAGADNADVEAGVQELNNYLAGLIGNNDDGNDDDSGGDDFTDTWFTDKYTYYTVTEGVAGDVSYSYDMNYTNFKDSGHCSYEYEYTIPTSSVQTTATYTSTTTGSQNYSCTYERYGNHAESELEIVSDSTTEYDYSNPDTPATTTTTHSDLTGTYTYTYLDGTDILSSYTWTSTSSSTQTTSGGTTSSNSTGTYEATYYEDTGIASRTVSQGTSNGTPYNTTTDYNFDQMGESDGVKEYKVYDSSTDGTQTYMVYKVKDGVQIETKSYSNGALYYTATRTFPTDATIREKVPSLTLYSYESASNPANNSYQTVEGLSDSSTQLTLRTKTFNSNGDLTG